VACIGALVAERIDGVWNVRSLGAPHMGERSEAELLQTFVDRVAELRPQMVTFKGSSFDLPVLRYRAMINRVSAPGLECRRYWYRYSDDCLDLCDALASYSPGGKISLHELCCALGFPGKPEGMDGGEVDRYVQEGRIGDVAAYCETDVVNTYRIWLVYELFRGTLTKTEFEASEANVLEFLRERITTKPHLELLLTGPSVSPFPAQEPSEIRLPRAIWPVQ
jgi:3'-5' exonuclease